MNRARGPQARLAAWIWLGPVAFLVHDAEEIVTVAPAQRSDAVAAGLVLQVPLALLALAAGRSWGRG